MKEVKEKEREPKEEVKTRLEKQVTPRTVLFLGGKYVTPPQYTTGIRQSVSNSYCKYESWFIENYKCSHSCQETENVCDLKRLWERIHQGERAFKQALNERPRCVVGILVNPKNLESCVYLLTRQIFLYVKWSRFRNNALLA